jgi:hypothetical protein
MAEVTEKGSQILVQSINRINSISLEIMEKQLEYFKARDMMTNTTQKNMVNMIVNLTQVLNSAFARNSPSVPVNKPQMLTKDRINKPPMLTQDHINIQVPTTTRIKENDDD